MFHQKTTRVEREGNRQYKPCEGQKSVFNPFKAPPPAQPPSHPAQSAWNGFQRLFLNLFVVIFN